MLARTNFSALQTPFIGKTSCVTPGPPTSLWFQPTAAQDVSTAFILSLVTMKLEKYGHKFSLILCWYGELCC